MIFLSARLFLVLAFAVWPFSKGPTTTVQEAEIRVSSLSLPADAESYRTVRVLLMGDVKEATIESDSSFQVFDGVGRPQMRGAKFPPVLFKPSPTGIMMGLQNFRTTILRVEIPDGSFKVGKREYRGSFTIWKKSENTISVINVLEIDDYLKGVLSWEANPKWSSDSLKAQAITSRTYALFKVIERQAQPYDVTGDVMSQVYKGKTSEKPETSRAVDATRGKILLYQGQIFPAYFHSTCGGATTRAHSVWPSKSHPALLGTRCDFCKVSKHYFWTMELKNDAITNALKKKGIVATDIHDFIPIDYDASERAQHFEIHHAGGKEIVHAGDFRLWVGPFKLKSTKIKSVEKTPDGFMVKGYGWGHGAGLCQYGMKHLGELGYSPKKILDYYFPGTDIIQYWT